MNNENAAFCIQLRRSTIEDKGAAVFSSNSAHVNDLYSVLRVTRSAGGVWLSVAKLKLSLNLNDTRLTGIELIIDVPCRKRLRHPTPSFAPGFSQCLSIIPLKNRCPRGILEFPVRRQLLYAYDTFDIVLAMM